MSPTGSASPKTCTCPTARGCCTGRSARLPRARRTVSPTTSFRCLPAGRAWRWRMLDPHRDQAEGLRRLFSRRGGHARVVTVASGCNGVGATGTVVNLAGALAARGHRILAIDENYGADNVAGSLGLYPRRDLHDVLAGECALEDALLTGPCDITVQIGRAH